MALDALGAQQPPDDTLSLDQGQHDLGYAGCRPDVVLFHDDRVTFHPHNPRLRTALPMQPIESDPTRYSETWAELNRELRRVEQSGGGLRGALHALGVHQHAQGFIKDDLRSMRRYNFAHPDEPTRFLRAQYNPSRALRFAGAGTSEPPAGAVVVHDGCFLCRDNIRWQQGGIELGYEVEVEDAEYIAWMNPFPLMPGSCVIASTDHVPQGWSANGTGPRMSRIERILAHLAALCERLPGYLGFHNGIGAGASIPSHLHLHFFDRGDADGAFPLEVTARQTGIGSHGMIEDYPVTAVYWRGDRADVVHSAAGWIRDWLHRNEHRASSISANIVSSFDVEAGLELFFVPRDKRRSHSSELSGGIGGLEVLGEVPFCTEEEGRRLELGEVDYHVLERILAAVRFD